MNSYEERPKKFNWLRDTDGHVALIQETHFVETNEWKYNSRWFGKCFHAFSNSSHARGVSVLFNNIDVDVENVHKTQDGRILLFILNFKTVDIQLSMFIVQIPRQKEYLFSKN
jgi:hypothetical protein